MQNIERGFFKFYKKPIFDMKVRIKMPKFSRNQVNPIPADVIL